MACQRQRLLCTETAAAPRLQLLLLLLAAHGSVLCQELVSDGDFALPSAPASVFRGARSLCGGGHNASSPLSFLLLGKGSLSFLPWVSNRVGQPVSLEAAPGIAESRRPAPVSRCDSGIGALLAPRG